MYVCEAVTTTIYSRCAKKCEHEDEGDEKNTFWTVCVCFLVGIVLTGAVFFKAREMSLGYCKY